MFYWYMFQEEKGGKSEKYNVRDLNRNWNTYWLHQQGFTVMTLQCFALYIVESFYKFL